MFRNKTFFAIVAVTLLFAGANRVFAADGSGTNTVSPTSTIVSTIGNTFTFTFTAAETMDSGEISLATPSNWSTIQGVSGTVGYTTATSTTGGIIADVINNANSATNWQKGRGCRSVALSASTYHEGTGSIECGNLSRGSNKPLQYYKLSSAVDWSAYTKAGFWIYSSIAVPSNILDFAFSSSNKLSSPQLVAIATAISKNTWTYVTLDISAKTRTSILSYGLQQVTADAAINHANIFIDDILAGPGSATFLGGGTIDVRLLSLANAQTVTFIYGSGGGTSGVTAPSTAGTSTATTTDRVSDGGILTNITSQPTLTAKNPVPTTTSISPTSTTAGSVQFTLTVNGTNFVASSTVDWNGSPRATTFASSTQLTVTILASDIASAGTSSITVVTPAPGGGTSNAQPFTINPVNTTTTVYSSATSSVYGSSVTFTAVVTPASGGAPTGTVTFKDGASTLGTATLNGANPGVATFATSSLTVAGSPHSITAVYGATGIFAGSTSTAVSQIITTKTLTITGITANNKQYDATTTAMLSGTPGTLVGIVDSDSVSLTGTAVGTFATSSVGNGIVVTVSGQSLTGAQASNYSLTEPTTTANITTKTLTATGITANNKQYDATTTATLNVGGASLVGVIASDTVTLNTASAVGTFATSSVGTGILVTISGLTISGVSSPNYSLTQPTTTASITNPVPTTTSISPTSTTAGGSDFTLTVNGTNFVASSTVDWNGLPRTTSFVSSTQVTATILASDIATTSTSSVVVFNAAPGGGISNSQTFSVVATTTLNPIPTIVSISPTSTIAGSGDFTLTVTGTNFIGSSTVQWNGSDRTTTFVSSSTITASITNTDIATAGTSTITIFNPVPGGGTSGSSIFTINPASSSSSAVKFIFTNVTTTAVAVGNSMTFNIEAVNASGTVDTSFEQAVTLTVGGSGSGGGLVTIVDGIGTSTVSDNVSQTITLGLQDSQSTGLNVSATANVTFVPGPVAQFTLNHPGNMNVGTRLGYTVGRKDKFGNFVSVNDTAVYLYTNSTSTNAAFWDAATGGTSVTSTLISGGSTSTAFWYYDNTSGSRTITVSDNSSTPNGPVTIANASDTFSVAPGAVKFIFSNVPSGATAGTGATLNIHAVDSLNNIDPTFNGGVTVTTSGSATGGGLVTLVDGVGTTTINDAIAETVGIGLRDTQSTDLGVTANASIIFNPAPVASTAAGAPPTQVAAGIKPGIKLTFSGMAYPGASVMVISKALGLQAAPVTQAIPVAADGSFLMQLNNVLRLTGQTYLLSFVDPHRFIAQTKAYNIPMRDKLVYGNILAAPTLGFENASVVTKGQPLFIMGYATPKATVKLFIDGNPAGTVVVNDPTGKYTYPIATDDLSFGRHSIWALQEYAINAVDVSAYENPLSQNELYVDDSTSGTLLIKNASGTYASFAPAIGETGTVNPVTVGPLYTKQAESDFSNQESFTVSPLQNPKLDLNGDGVIDVKDLSIFLSYLKNLNASIVNFHITNPNIINVLDFNGDGVVDIKDLDILEAAILYP